MAELKKYKNTKIQISDNGLSPTNSVKTYNHQGEEVNSKVAGELPLTIKINNNEANTDFIIYASKSAVDPNLLHNTSLYASIICSW